MKRRIAKGCAALAAAICCVMAHAVTPERLQFDSLDHWDGDKPLTIDGYLFKPADKARYPAIVMFHGCAGGLTKSGKISRRFQNMADLLSGMGYGVLLVDSFNPRGHREICTTKPKNRTIFAKQRWLDAYGALAYLNGRSDVVPGKIGAIGFSHGGTNALQVVDATLPPYQEALKKSGKGFAASVSFYPGCSDVLRQTPQFSAYAPLLVLVGELDDWTPAINCQRLIGRSEGRGEPVQIVTYEGAYHSFDDTSEVRVRTDVTHGVNGAAGVHVGGNPAARADAYQRVREFFAEHLGE